MQRITWATPWMNSVPIWQLKALIPLAGGMLFIQGVAQVIRCILAIKTGEWPRKLHDVEELEDVIAEEHAHQVEGTPKGEAA